MVAAGLFDVIDPQDPEWTLSGAIAAVERQREIAMANDFAPGPKSVTRASLVDLLERPQAGPEFDRLNGENCVAKPFDLAGISAMAAAMMRNAPQGSNTGGMNSQVPPERGDDALLAPREYLFRPSPKNYVQLPEAHWTDTDPGLFASLPQGGGGIDWLTASIYGRLNERGKALVESLKEIKKWMGKKEGVADRAAECGLHLEVMKYREHMVFSHPFRANSVIQLAFGTAGKGRSYQPLIIHCEGVCVTFGRLEDSEGPNGTRGPVATVQITGVTFLRLGEDGAFALAHEIVKSLGIVNCGMRASRLDVCADLPGATVDEFAREYMAGNEFSKAKSGADIKMGPDRRVQTFGIKSGAVKLRIYDKVAECKAKDPTGERMGMMEQNRWGGPQESAVRVEFQFNMGKNRAKKYTTFRELFAGMSDLIGWVTNHWFRLAFGEDRTHSGRYKGVESMCDCWLRTLHAFAFWSGRLDHRHVPPRIQSRPCQHLINQAIGTFAAALGKAGIVPVDNMTGWGIMDQWQGPDALAQRCREKALENMATHGVEIRSVSLRSTEDEREFSANRGRQRIEQESSGGVPF